QRGFGIWMDWNKQQHRVESPLAVDAVLGESSFSVTDDKVSITEMKVHAISGLTLSLQPSPGNSHTMVAKATGVQTLTAPKQRWLMMFEQAVNKGLFRCSLHLMDTAVELTLRQMLEASLSIWMLFSDNTAATLTNFDPKDYNFNASSLDDRVVMVSQEYQQRWPVVVAEGEGSGELVRFGPEEDSEEEGATEGEIELAPFTRRPIIDPNIKGQANMDHSHHWVFLGKRPAAEGPV
ncbi:hypothetical protein KUCAC02_026814, partial [Chaenocephalus aceratus]